jgi:hypothetical protein
MGCAYAMAAGDPASMAPSHHGMAVAPVENKAGAHNCCSKPDGDQPEGGPEQGQFKECCFRLVPATMGKDKPEQVKFAASERLVLNPEPAHRVELHAGSGATMDAASGIYLKNRVLRI